VGIAAVIYYFDADAQVKYFINEPGSAWVRRLVDEVDADGRPLHDLSTLEVSLVEVSAALALIQRWGRIGKRLRDRAFRDYLNFANIRLRMLTVDATLVSEASTLPQTHPLKALDALHLAAAVRLSRELAARQLTLTFVSSDQHLLTAARSEGLQTVNPHDHSESGE